MLSVGASQPVVRGGAWIYLLLLHIMFVRFIHVVASSYSPFILTTDSVLDIYPH